MKPSESPSSASYVGHVKNGVVVLDTHVTLHEGQAMRVEPLVPTGENLVSDERDEQIRHMQALFAQWDEEDKETSDENAEAFHKTLERNRGLSFHVPKVD